MTVETRSAGGVVIGPDGRVLVVDQGTSWSLPKGHIEEGEDSLAAAEREIEEESGVSELKFVRELGSYRRDSMNSPDEMKTIIMYLFRTNQEELQPLDPHNPQAKWVDMNEVAHLLTHPVDKKFFLSIITKLT